MLVVGKTDGFLLSLSGTLFLKVMCRCLGTCVSGTWDIDFRKTAVAAHEEWGLYREIGLLLSAFSCGASSD